MNKVETVCLKLCEEIVSTSSVTDKTVLNRSVRLSQIGDKKAEVILVTKEDEYIFELDLPDEELYSEPDCHHHYSKCASENKYNIQNIRIKGFHTVEFGVTDLQHIKVILEKLAKDHATCIEENNLENKNYKTGCFSVTQNKHPFLDGLQQILNELNEDTIDQKIFLEGIRTIENSYEKLLKFEEDYVFVFGNILSNKLIFVKNSGKYLADYKILNIRTEQSVPLVYDLLLTIFSFTDQDMRQRYFHELLDYYYKSLEEKLSLDVRKLLPLMTFQKQVNRFIPRVKLDILQQLCQSFVKNKNSVNGKTSKKKLEAFKSIRTAVLEVNECVLYPNLSREDCLKILKNKIGCCDYTFRNYRLIPLQEREGHLGDYFKLKIEIECDGSIKLLHLFAKYLPTYNDIVKGLALDSFKKEEFYYLQFIPALNDLGLNDITDFLPKCYFSRTNEVLVFEDMTMMNYKTVPVSETCSYEMLRITITKLAKIHASSLLYEELLSKDANDTVRIDEKFPEYIEEMTILNTEETMIKKTFDCAIRTFLDMLKVFPDIPKKFSVEEFRKRSKIVFDLCFEKVKKSDKFRNVLCQGDCWTSNILFKTDKDSCPVDCCLVDYQLTRYCPVAHDIYYLLYMTTTKEIRTKYESKLLQEYYSELSNILQIHNVDIQKIYTYQEFLECCEYMRSQGLCHAIMILQYVLFPQEKLKTIFQDKEQTNRLLYANRDIFIQELNYNAAYGRRMKELAEEMNKVCENMSVLI